MKHSIIATVFLVAAVASCYGQQATKSFTVINGKEHPGLIDDATAYLHCFGWFDRKAGEPQERYDSRRRAYVNLTGLNGNQGTLLLAAADSFAQQMQSLKQAGRVDPTVRSQILLGVVGQLQQALGAQGTAALTKFVSEVVKPTINIYKRALN